jgi:hypothetical protein
VYPLESHQHNRPGHHPDTEQDKPKEVVREVIDGKPLPGRRNNGR